MSSLVAFEDLSLLDAGDLRAVFAQVEPERLLDALVGTSPAFRQRLLSCLVSSTSHELETKVSAHGPVSFELVQSAQHDLIEALCRLSRAGQVAFDDPADMVA